MTHFALDMKRHALLPVDTHRQHCHLYISIYFHTKALIGIIQATIGGSVLKSLDNLINMINILLLDIFISVKIDFKITVFRSYRG